MACITLKVTHLGEIRRTHFMPSQVSYAGVVQAIEHLFPAITDYTPKYEDEQGDMCTLTETTFDDFMFVSLSAPNSMAPQNVSLKVELVEAPVARAAPRFLQCFHKRSKPAEAPMHYQMPAPVAVSRRDMLSAAAGAAAVSLPHAALADGAKSKYMRNANKQKYGAKVWSLQSASLDGIIEDIGVLDVYIDGVYNSPSDKPMRASLGKIKSTIVSAVAKGDAPGATAAVKEFVKTAGIDNYDANPDTFMALGQTRNAGSPVTGEIPFVDAENATEFGGKNKWPVFKQ